MAVLFVSDLHLDAARPWAIEAFVRFLSDEALYAERLFILGDLFEVWIGDDVDEPAMRPVLDALAMLASADVPCYFLRGNRDFLVGRGFSERTGCKVLSDYVTVDLYGKPALLAHGDLLCTDDKPYMQLRATVRDPMWQRDFLSKSVAQRRSIAASMREQSRTETASKPPEIMDVNRDAVDEAMRSHGVTHLIHGHTHRPAVHRFLLDNQQAARIVLGDWYEQGSVLSWDQHGFRLRTIPTEGLPP
jgi:UDP-2,3-diacylglucosamine hydrolase